MLLYLAAFVDMSTIPGIFNYPMPIMSLGKGELDLYEADEIPFKPMIPLMAITCLLAMQYFPKVRTTVAV